MDSHYVKDAKHVCCGVRLDHAAEYGVSDPEDYAYEFKGEIWTGGCWQVFSRRDALLRHLKHSKTGCVSESQSRTRKKFIPQNPGESMSSQYTFWWLLIRTSAPVDDVNDVDDDTMDVDQ